MPKFRNKRAGWISGLLIGLAGGSVLLADITAEKPSYDARRVAAHLACQCGCKDTVATCAMLECSFSKPAKERIAKLQAAGWTDKAIIDQFIADYGPGIYRGDPNAMGWLVPYLLIIPGLALIWWFVRRYRRPRAIPEIGPAPDDPELAKYQEQIEKDLAHLE
ncbi:MAG TPA: cytochrome c-type biogenesis protein CcmH [Bryobacteraceae bacterium]|nr:cytochrome c-type biogenesis protein CcmH [Bryobacteraceae bacterium]